MTAAWGAIAATLTGIAAAYAALSRPGRRLEQLRIEVDILDKLDGGSARDHMQQLVDAHAEDLAERLHVRRFWLGIIGGALAYVFAAASDLAAIRSGEFWLVASSVPLFAVAGVSLYGAFRAGSRVPRDREGFRLKPHTGQSLTAAQLMPPPVAEFARSALHTSGNRLRFGLPRKPLEHPTDMNVSAGTPNPR